MNMVPAHDENDTDQQADRQADAMKAHLRKDVASWSAERNETSPRPAVEVSPPVVKQPSPQPIPKARKAKPAAAVVKPAVPGKKPFSMSYDGMTSAQHIENMIARGAR